MVRDGVLSQVIDELLDGNESEGLPEETFAEHVARDLFTALKGTGWL